jgi:hypothetical protein
LGFVRGAVFGALFLLGDLFICAYLPFAFPGLVDAPWQVFGVAHVAVVLIGGVVGGYSARPRSHD